MRRLSRKRITGLENIGIGAILYLDVYTCMFEIIFCEIMYSNCQQQSQRLDDRR